MNEIVAQGALSFYVRSSISVLKLVSFFSGEVVVLEPAMFHTAPRQDADNVKSPPPGASVNEVILMLWYCAMVFSVAHQVNGCSVR